MRPWTKGVSGNPGGRPKRGKGTPKNYARGFLRKLGYPVEDMNDDDIFETFDQRLGEFWATKFKSKNEKIQVEAAKEIQDRVKGKTIQQTISVEIKPHVEWDLSKPGSVELAERITESLGELHRISGGAGDVREPGEVEALPAPEGDQPKTA
jgi:hypothetical protein